MADDMREKVDWAFDVTLRNTAMTIAVALLIPYAMAGRRPTEDELVADCERYEHVGRDIIDAARSNALQLVALSEAMSRKQ